MLKCDFNKIAFWHGCSPVNLLHIFGTPFPKKTSEWLLLWITFKLGYQLSVQIKRESLT